MTNDTNSKEKTVENNGSMSIMDHLTELRRRLIWSLVTFVIAFFICYHFSDHIYNFLAEPLAKIMRARGEQPHLIYTALYEAFFTNVKLAMFGAFFLSFPIIAIQGWIFIAPGLYYNEKKAFAPFLIATPILFLAGAALAYYVIFPYAWEFFLSFQQAGNDNNVAIELQARVSEYLTLVTKMILSFGICFELPVILTLIVRAGLVQTSQLKKFRRYAYLLAFVIAAIIAPPDAVTMLSLAVPLIALYEISIFVARLVEKKEITDQHEDSHPSQEGES